MSSAVRHLVTPQESNPNVGLFRLPAHRANADALAGPEGFGFLSKDNDFGMMLHPVLQADARYEPGTLRMARACRLIKQGWALADVALEVGYSEQSALARQFRRVVGITPGAYARAAP